MRTLLLLTLAAASAMAQVTSVPAATGTSTGGASADGTVQKGNGSGGFSGTSVTDNGTTVSTAEPLAAKSATTGDGTASGIQCVSGLSSGSVCFAAADAAGTAIAYIYPSANGTSGQVMKDNGTTTCPTLPAGSPATCHQMAWTGISVPTLPQNPTTSDTDAICAATAGSPACPSGGVIGGTTSTPFQSTLVLGSGVPAANKVIRWTISLDYGAATALPTVAYSLKACLQANYNTTTGACSSGGVTIWTSLTAALSAATTSGIQSMLQFTFQGGGSNTLYTTLSAAVGGGIKGTNTASTNATKASFTNSGTWVIALFVQYGTATAGNWTQVTQSIAEALN